MSDELAQKAQMTKPQTFEEWEAATFAGVLRGGRILAQRAWHARDGEVESLKAELAARIAEARLEERDAVLDEFLVERDRYGEGTEEWAAMDHAQAAIRMRRKRAAAKLPSEGKGDRR